MNKYRIVKKEIKELHKNDNWSPYQLLEYAIYDHDFEYPDACMLILDALNLKDEDYEDMKKQYDES